MRQSPRPDSVPAVARPRAMRLLALGAFLLLLAFPAACSRTPSPEPVAKPAPPAVPQTPAPAPAVSQEPAASPVARDFDLDVRVWRTSIVVRLEGKEKKTLTLPRGAVLFALRYEPPVLIVKTPENKRGRVTLCDTDFALRALTNQNMQRSLPDLVRFSIMRDWRACMDRTLANPGQGIVMQGPVVLAESAEAAGRAKEGPKVDSWQVLDVLGNKVLPGGELALRVGAGTGQSGWISAHHFARGGTRQSSLQQARGFSYLHNVITESPLRTDIWVFTNDFSFLRPLGAKAGAGAPLTPRESPPMDEAWLRQLGPAPIEDFMLTPAEALKRLAGEWVPTGYLADGGTRLSCEQLPARLVISPQGVLSLTLGAMKKTFAGKSLQVAPNGALQLHPTADPTASAPIVILHYGVVPRGRLQLEFIGDAHREWPLTFVRPGSESRAILESRTRQRYGCH